MQGSAPRPTWSWYFEGVSAEVNALCETAWVAASERWPGMSVTAADLRAHLTQLHGDNATVDHLATLALSDVMLACACLQGDRAALRAFDEAILQPLRNKIRSIVGRDDDAEDVLQRVRVRLLVGEGTAPVPSLRGYQGRGSLAAWVRVSASRLALNAVRDGARRADWCDELVNRVVAPDDPELDFLRTRYRDVLANAIRSAILDLTPAERALLHLSGVHRVSIDRVAVLQGTHRATAARQIRRAKDKLALRARAHVHAQLRAAPATVDSLERLLRSQLDMELAPLLANAAAT